MAISISLFNELNAYPKVISSSIERYRFREALGELMNVARLGNKYLADEELLDESDTNQVKISLAKDSFGLFEECVQKVYNARGPKLTSKEVIRLQTALLHYSIKCFPGHVEQVGRCIKAYKSREAVFPTMRNPEHHRADVEVHVDVELLVGAGHTIKHVWLKVDVRLELERHAR